MTRRFPILGAPGWARSLSLLWVLFLLAGCASFELPRLALPVTPTSALPTGIFATVTPTPQETVSPQGTSASQPVLTLWLPPEFDPNADTPASRLLRERLRVYASQHPELQLNVRIKAQSGPGGLLESLSAASAAAPGAVPSLVALARSDLENAALKGLVFPLDGLSESLQDTDWYPYARDLAQIQGTPFGLPFGGDALLLVYRPARMGPAPLDWNALLGLNQPVVFPAADPQSYLTLNLYLMLGGKVQDEQRRPILQPDVLARALKLYMDGIQPGVFPYWLSQVQTDRQAWQAYQDQRGQWLVSWSSAYLAAPPEDSNPMALPALGDKPLSLASGWVWALSDPYAERRPESVRLAEFLTDRDFLAAWTAALGLLPPRPSSLSAWPDSKLKPVISQVVLSAQVRPSNDLMSSLGPALETATLQVIKRESEPSQAAQSAAERLAVPNTK